MIEIASSLLIEDITSYEIQFSDTLPLLAPYAILLSSLILWRLRHLDIRAMRLYNG